MSSLIPNGKKLLENNYNVILLGLHGTGKTTAIFDLAKEMDIKVAYFSCSTLDPYTDLVGVPVPIERKEGGGRELEMVRPRSIDEAELIFFDEFNRADRQTLNAIFEIIQFKSINGERLPKLKACWAAMNPPNEEYQVVEVDPALLDRFDVFLNVSPHVSVDYMKDFIKIETARILKAWWDQHGGYSKGKDGKISYISPRRLLKMGLVWDNTKKPELLRATLPPGEVYDVGKLLLMLQPPPPGVKTTTSLSEPPPLPYYSPAIIQRNLLKIVEDLKAKPGALEYHQAVATALSKGIGPDNLINIYGPILGALSQPVLEKMLTGFGPAKLSMLRAKIASIGRYKSASSLKRKAELEGFITALKSVTKVRGSMLEGL